MGKESLSDASDRITGTSGPEQADFPTVVAKSQKASSMQGNPIRLTEKELLEILQMAL